jgi:hypothetical protein
MSASAPLFWTTEIGTAHAIASAFAPAFWGEVDPARWPSRATLAETEFRADDGLLSVTSPTAKLTPDKYLPKSTSAVSFPIPLET